jgi:serine/threonine protein kinase
VAVKIMHQGQFGGLRDRSRFEREIQVLGQLSHPNIVSILDSGMASGNAYFIMDHIVGVPFDRWVADGELPIAFGQSADTVTRTTAHKSQSSLDQSLRLFVKVCDAVHAAHLRGIIHRDLKPNNILVDSNGEPHVLDFGLAKFDAIGGDSSDVAGVTTTGHFIGSLPWASPEQAAGDSGRIDIRTDVYSLGVILYHALVGKFPYSVACGIRDALDRITNLDPARPSTVARGLNDELDTIVLKCLAKEPERRYATAGELARDIRHYLSQEPIEAKRESTWYILRKTIRRHRVVAATLFALFFIVIGSAVLATFLMWQAQRSEEKAQWNLRDSLVAQARARRQVITAGRRVESLETLSRAAAMRPGVDLRNEVIATLAVPTYPERSFPRRLVPAPSSSVMTWLTVRFQCPTAVSSLKK